MGSCTSGDHPSLGADCDLKGEDVVESSQDHSVMLFENMLICTVEESRLRWLDGWDSAVDGSKGQVPRMEGPSGYDCSMLTNQGMSFRTRAVEGLAA